MATDIPLPRPSAGAFLVRTRVRAPRWSAQAWGSIALTALFLAITCWWLTQDRAIPTFDAGFQLSYLQRIYHERAAGHVFRAVTLERLYPPFAYLIGDLGVAVAGMGVAPPLLAENLFFVPLRPLGCYHVGKRAFGPTAGLLAVVFALGSPLVTAQFHVFMLDAPETAMVAGAGGLIIASEGFSRVGVSALAGLAVGVGLLTKEPFVFFVAGILAVTLVRMGIGCVRDRSPRRLLGLGAFTLVALAVALPWYIKAYAYVEQVAVVALAQANHPVYTNNIAPARYTLNNLSWYFWNFLNFQLYLPLFLFAASGWIWMSVRLARRKPVQLTPELMIGALVAWDAITESFVHDNRYSEPLLVYLAVIGTGWLVQLKRNARIALISILAVIAMVNTLGASFGVGREVGVTLASTNTLQDEGDGMILDNGGFLVGKPIRDGDMLATLQALRDHGVRSVELSEKFLIEPDFSLVGLTALSEIAGLKLLYGVPANKLSARDATFAHRQVEQGDPPPCVTLGDGTGVWIRLGNPTAKGTRDYCPTRHPAFYG